MEHITTAYGQVTLERLVEVYNLYKKHESRKAEKRKEFLQTEEGKQYNRERAKSYYERNKDAIRVKARSKYVKKVDQPQAQPPQESPVA